MAPRQNVQKEWRLLSWWLATRHPNADISMNVKVGPPRMRQIVDGGVQSQVQSSRVFNRYADAVFSENGQLWVVEAKMTPDPGVFSQLRHYARLIRADPAWRNFASSPLIMAAVVYQTDPEVEREAASYGVRWEVFSPDLSVVAPPRIRDGLAQIAGENVPLPDNWASVLNSWGATVLPTLAK